MILLEEEGQWMKMSVEEDDRTKVKDVEEEEG